MGNCPGIGTFVGSQVGTALHLGVSCAFRYIDRIVVAVLFNAVRNSVEANVLLFNDKLMVSNPSRNGVPLERGRLFRRFTSAPDTKGNGLGLSIAKAICDFHHWSIEYGFVDGCHWFTVEMG